MNVRSARRASHQQMSRCPTTLSVACAPPGSRRVKLVTSVEAVPVGLYNGLPLQLTLGPLLWTWEIDLRTNRDADALFPTLLKESGTYYS